MPIQNKERGFCMRIVKGGISRNIDENKIFEYKDKGYVPVTESEESKEYEKPLEEFNLKELREFAKINGIDISGAKTKEEVLKAMEKWFEENKLPKGEENDEQAGENK